MAQTIADLEIKISSQSSNASENIDKLAKSLENLKNNAKLTTVKNNLNKLSESLNNLQSSSSSLKNINKLSNSLNGLSSSFKKINSTKAVQGIVSYSGATQKATASNKHFGTSLAWVATKATLLYQGITRAFNAIGQFVKNSNDYIENMNIFHVAMGGMYDEAFEYAQLVNQKLGIDISEWTRNQAVFASMANGFGLAEEQVYKLSKGLTEVSYDLASLYNAETETAFTKVRSALAGEIEPLRQWGFALDQNTLQQVANAHGINLQYSAMTQSQKAMLRYTAIVEQATKQGAIFTDETGKKMGDMARTLDSPANSIRILQQQFTQLGRAIGNVFLPILQQVIPYVQAVTRVLTDLISKLATLVGFTMPTWDNSSWEGTSGAIDEATESAKEYKNATMGFDELNTITPPSSSSGGNGYASDLGLDIESVWDKGALEAITTEVDTLVSKIETLFAKLTQPLEVISFDNLKLALENLGIALAPFNEQIGAGLWWLYTNVLVPLAEWTIEEALPAFINGLADAITNVTPKLEAFGKWFWDNKEIIGLTALAILGAYGAFNALVSISNGILAFTGALAGIGSAFATVSTAISGIGTMFSTIGTYVWYYTTMLGEALGLTGSFATIVGGAIIVAVVGAFIQLYATVESFRNKVNELVSLVANTFVTVFQDLWNIVLSVKDIFVSLWNDALVPLWNFVVSFLEPIFVILIDVITILWKDVIDPLVTTVSGVLKEAFESFSDLITDSVLPAIKLIIEGITWLWEHTFKPFIMWLWDKLKPVVDNVFTFVKDIITTVGDVVSSIFGGIMDVIGGLIDFLVGVFTGDWEKAWQGVSDIFNGIWDAILGFFTGIGDVFMSFGKNIVDGIIRGITNMWDKLKSTVSELAEGVTSWFKDILGINSPSKEMEDNGYFTVEGVIVGIENAQNLVKTTVADLGTILVDTFKGVFNPTVFSGIATETINAFSTTLFSLLNTLITTLMGTLNKMFNDITTLTSTSMTLTVSVVDNAMSSIRSSVSTTTSAVGSMVSSMLSKIQSAVSSASSSLSQLSSMASRASSLASSISSSVSSASSSLSSLQTQASTVGVKAYATGGVVSTGQMFIAREAGAELVGNIGGRTSVMNNDQIVQAVSQGVAQAVSSVMGGNNNQNITIELDGEVLYRSNQRVEKRLGYNLGI